MAKSYNFFNGTQEDINRRLLRKIEALEAKVGSEGTDITEIESDVEALQTAVGDATSGLVKDVADIETAIGDESTAGTILARIKTLEDAS